MIQNLHSVIHLIEGEWSRKRMLVVGDVMLDRYIWGQVERISPEAPVPVVHADRHNAQPGDAANAAMNIAGLGARAVLFGFCGDDADGAALHQCLTRSGVEAQLTSVPGHPTTAKLRILGGKQQMLRLDTECVDGYPVGAFAELMAAVRKSLDQADALVLSDYAKGVLTPEVCHALIADPVVHGPGDLMKALPGSGNGERRRSLSKH